MGLILHDWNLERKMHLIRAAYDALPEGGAFIVIENLIDDARRENAFGLLMSLNMLIEFGDAFDFTGADFAGWCGGRVQGDRGRAARRSDERRHRVQVLDRVVGSHAEESSGPARAVQSRSSASSTRSAWPRLSARQCSGSGRSGSLAVLAASARRRPVLGGLGRERRLVVSRLLQEARVHQAEVAAAGPAALDHLVAEAGAPLPVLGGLRPAAGLGGEAPQRGQALEVAERRLEHLPAPPARSPPGSWATQVVAVDRRPSGR